MSRTRARRSRVVLSMPAETLADHLEAEWPMPSAEVQRLLDPVPRWGDAPRDDAEPESD